MSKIFETNFEQGSLIEKVSGKPLTTFWTPTIKQTEKGLSSASGGYATGINLGTNNFSYIVTIKPKNIINNTYVLLDNFDNASHGLLIGFYNIGNTSYLFYQYGGGGSYTFTIPGYNMMNKWTFLKITRINNFIKFDINNGKIVSTSNQAAYFAGQTNSFILGGQNVSSAFRFYGFCNKAILYNHILSQKEINDKYIQFLNSKPTAKPVIFNPNLSILKPNEVKDNGLIAAYNFNPVGNKIVNIAYDNPANGNNARQYDGTIVKKCLITNNGLKIGGQVTYANRLNLGSANFTICTILKIDSGYRFDMGSNATVESFLMYFDYTRINNDAGTNLFSGSALPTNSTVTVVFTRVGNVFNQYINGILQVGTVNSLAGGNISFTNMLLNNNNILCATFIDLKIYNKVLSDQQIKNYHNQWASKEVLYEDFSQYTVNSFI